MRPRPSRLVLAFAAALAAGAPVAALAHPPAASRSQLVLAVEREVLAAREAIASAVAAKDVAALKALYAPEFIHVHSSGQVYGRDARILDLLTGETAIETAPTTTLIVRAPTASTAVVEGVTPISRADGGGFEVRWTQVFANGGTGWILASSHVTRVTPPPTN